MEQVNPNRYRVRPGEVVTVQATGTGVANSFLDFTADTALSTNDPAGGTYAFKVTKLVGQIHFGRIVCTFPPGAVNDARFDTTLSGSGGGSFTGPEIQRASEFPAENLRFEVVA